MWDWWHLKKKHTPYQWALQQVGQIVDPIGEERADLRTARAVIEIIDKMVPGLTEQQLNAIGSNVRNYLAHNQPPEPKPLTPEEGEALERGEQ